MVSSLIIDPVEIMIIPGHPGFFVCGMMGSFRNEIILLRQQIFIYHYFGHVFSLGM